MKLLLIEDDPIWQTKIQILLKELNFTDLELCDDIVSAQEYLLHTIPNLIIADIFLGDNLVFELFKNPNNLEIPFVFITSSDEQEIYNTAKINPHSTYLVKPFHKISFLAAIEKVMLHIVEKKTDSRNIGLSVKGIHQEKIFLPIEHIVFIKSSLNYCIIKTPKNQFIIKSSFASIKEQLGDSIIQTHKTYLVNKSFILNINLIKMNIETVCGSILIGRMFKENVLEYLNEVRKF